MSWAEGRPIHLRLPEKGFQDSEAVGWVTTWADEVLTAKRIQLEDFYRQLDPDLCQAEGLDYLAFLVGFSGEYWDSAWVPEVKRDFIRESYSLWKTRGTLGCMARVLEIQGILSDLWLDGVLRLGFRIPGTFGTPKPRVYIRLPKSYARQGPRFREAERTRKNWVPCIVRSKVTYRKFYLGFSLLGDPLF